MNTPVASFEDIEAIVVSYLTAELIAIGCPVPVSTEHPKSIDGPMPAAWVRVLAAGGARTSTFVDSATVILESRASDGPRAADLARAVRAVISTMDRLNEPSLVVYRVDEISRPQNLPDPVSGQSRYTQTHSIQYAGFALGSTSKETP